MIKPKNLLVYSIALNLFAWILLNGFPFDIFPNNILTDISGVVSGLAGSFGIAYSVGILTINP